MSVRQKVILKQICQFEITKNWTVKRKRAFLRALTSDEKCPSLSVVKRYINNNLNLSFKKVSVWLKDVFVNLEAVTALLDYIKIKINEGYIFCSLDETGYGNKSLRHYSWAEKGIPARHKFIRQPNIILICCISPTRVLGAKFVRGGVDRFIFEEYLKEVFTLQHQYNPDQKLLILLDNVSFHSTSRVKQLIKNSPHILLFNVPYKSQGNPIEYLFSDLKTRLKDLIYVSHE